MTQRRREWPRPWSYQLKLWLASILLGDHMQAADKDEPAAIVCPLARTRVKSNFNLSLAYVLALEAT